MTSNSHEPRRGERFSHVYLERGQPLEDSPRVRSRVAALIGMIDRDFDELASVLPIEMGLDVPWNGAYRWEQFTAKIELRDFLDFITVSFRELVRRQRRSGLLTPVPAPFSNAICPAGPKRPKRP